MSAMSHTLKSDGNSEKKVNTEVRVVPWYNAAQFRKVYQYLYSPDIEKKNSALDQITIWKSRCDAGLPSAIEASFALVTAFVADDLWTIGNSFYRQIDIEMLYGAAVSKFVSSISESHRDLFQNGVTTALVAKRLGVPPFIVDIRNDSFHSLAPSLAYLRMASEDALDHLKKTYWEVEVAQVKNYVEKCPDTNEATDLIRQFMKSRIEIMMDKEKMAEEEKDIEEYLPDLYEFVKKNKSLFIHALSMDNNFIPQDDDLKFYVDEETYKLFEEDYDAESEKHDDVTLSESSILPGVPELHETLWEPIIHLLNLFDAIPLFMEALLKTLGDRTVAGQKLIIAWILKILRIHNVRKYAKDSALRKIFKSRAILVNWETMFFTAMKNPCIYTSFVLPLILSHLNIKEKNAIKAMKLFASRFGLMKIKTGALDTDKIYTMEDINSKRNFKRDPKGLLIELEDSACLVVTDHRHKSWPIGKVLNPVKENEESGEEDDFDTEEKEFKIQYIIGNENDTEEHYCEMDNSVPDTFFQDIMTEIHKRKTFLYK